ncbi:hypothetical protein BLNAU_7872 [Blattamonas nauphoetae]|uniref:Uncharacterized protein n=1 Tax=Blattamonas nauphoetae TaxID=2049346 RepID=A0ABQ9XZY4_9EUKA|nr:hypothetical protein BLNAU_7872 [Blattamonas nauphoetae]
MFSWQDGKSYKEKLFECDIMLVTYTSLMSQLASIIRWISFKTNQRISLEQWPRMRTMLKNKGFRCPYQSRPIEFDPMLELSDLWGLLDSGQQKEFFDLGTASWPAFCVKWHRAVLSQPTAGKGTRSGKLKATLCIQATNRWILTNPLVEKSPTHLVEMLTFLQVNRLSHRKNLRGLVLQRTRDPNGSWDGVTVLHEKVVLSVPERDFYAGLELSSAYEVHCLFKRFASDSSLKDDVLDSSTDYFIRLHQSCIHPTLLYRLLLQEDHLVTLPSFSFPHTMNLWLSDKSLTAIENQAHVRPVFAEENGYFAGQIQTTPLPTSLPRLKGKTSDEEKDTGRFKQVTKLAGSTEPKLEDTKVNINHANKISMVVPTPWPISQLLPLPIKQEYSIKREPILKHEHPVKHEPLLPTAHSTKRKPILKHSHTVKVSRHSNRRIPLSTNTSRQHQNTNTTAHSKRNRSPKEHPKFEPFSPILETHAPLGYTFSSQTPSSSSDRRPHAHSSDPSDERVRSVSLSHLNVSSTIPTFANQLPSQTISTPTHPSRGGQSSPTLICRSRRSKVSPLIHPRSPIQPRRLVLRHCRDNDMNIMIDDEQAQAIPTQPQTDQPTSGSACTTTLRTRQNVSLPPLSPVSSQTYQAPRAARRLRRRDVGMDRVSSREDTASDSAIGSIRPKHSVPTIFSTTHGGHSIRKQNVSIPKATFPVPRIPSRSFNFTSLTHFTTFHACLFNHIVCLFCWKVYKDAPFAQAGPGKTHCPVCSEVVSDTSLLPLALLQGMHVLISIRTGRLILGLVSERIREDEPSLARGCRKEEKRATPTRAPKTESVAKVPRSQSKRQRSVHVAPIDTFTRVYETLSSTEQQAIKLRQHQRMKERILQDDSSPTPQNASVLVLSQWHNVLVLLAEELDRAQIPFSWQNDPRSTHKSSRAILGFFNHTACVVSPQNTHIYFLDVRWDYRIQDSIVANCREKFPGVSLTLVKPVVTPSIEERIVYLSSQFSANAHKQRARKQPVTPPKLTFNLYMFILSGRSEYLDTSLKPHLS